MSNHILIATDLNEQNHDMLQKAYGLADKLQGEVSLVHVVERDPAANHIYVEQDKYEEIVNEEIRNKYEAMVNKYNLPKSELIIRVGTAKHDVLRVAEELNADLLIVGSHSQHGFQRILGSTANAIVHGANCDVFVIRHLD